MSNIVVVFGVTDGLVETWGACVSGNHANERVAELKSKFPETQFFVQKCAVVDVDEDSFLRLQNKLSRVQNRLGKSRKNVRVLKEHLADFDNYVEILREDIKHLNKENNQLRDQNIHLEDENIQLKDQIASIEELARDNKPDYLTCNTVPDLNAG